MYLRRKALICGEEHRETYTLASYSLQREHRKTSTNPARCFSGMKTTYIAASFFVLGESAHVTCRVPMEHRVVLHR